MELGTEGRAQCSTFTFTSEDHTLGNSLRYVLNKDPRVSYVGYTVPHPSENKVNVRVQTTGEAAKEVLKDGLLDLTSICEQVNRTFEAAVEKFKSREENQAS